MGMPDKEARKGREKAKLSAFMGVNLIDAYGALTGLKTAYKAKNGAFGA